MPRIRFAIAVAGRGFEARISTEYTVPLPDSACVYCGNCIAVCPTGALMFRSEYDMRATGTWDESAQSETDTICSYCGVGCSLRLHIQDNEIVKVMSPLESEITQGNLCIKGTFRLAVHATAEESNGCTSPRRCRLMLSRQQTMRTLKLKRYTLRSGVHVHRVSRRKPTSVMPESAANSTARLEGAPTAATTGTLASRHFWTISKPARPLTSTMPSSRGSSFRNSAAPIILSTALWRPMSSRSRMSSPAASKSPAACRAPVSVEGILRRAEHVR